MLDKIIQKKLHEVRIVLGCKNHTNTHAVLELWVLDVGTGFGQRGKEPTKMWKIEGLFPSFLYISNNGNF